MTKAAEALHITQPAVSGQLKNLEEELGVDLFSRTTSSVALTQCGQELLGKAERAVDAFGEFIHSAKAFRGQLEGALKLGVVMLGPDMMRIGPFVQCLATHYPGLEINLQVGRTSWLHDALRSSEIDGAILVCKSCPKDAGDLKLKELTFRVVAPAAWKQRIENAGPKELEKLSWIKMAQRSAHQEMMSEILQRMDIKPVETVEADHESLICSLVAAGVGIGLVRDDLALKAEAAGDLIFVGKYQTTISLSFLYPKDRRNDPIILAAMEALSKVWGLSI